MPSAQPSGLPGEDGHQTEGGRAASRLCLHVSFYGKCLVLRLGLWPGRVWLALRLFNCEAHALISRLARRGALASAWSLEWNRPWGGTRVGVHGLVRSPSHPGGRLWALCLRPPLLTGHYFLCVS